MDRSFRSLASDGAASARAAPPPSLREYAYEQIRQRILTSDLAPGEPLAADGLAAELGISRTPVREALQELAKEGLVQLVPHKGAFTARFTRRDIEEIFQIRVALEPLAAQLAAPNIPEEELAELEAELRETRSRLDEGDSAAHFDFDARLHQTVLRYSPNRRLAAQVGLLKDQLQLIWLFWAGHGLDHIRQSDEEHERLLEALRRRDGRAARQAMTTHLQAAGKRIADLVEKAQQAA